jgi:RNA recognition motif-containing protein
MQTTLVALAGKGSNPKTTLYVGGLEENVNDTILHSAFLPFGDIKDVSIPLDHATGKHRGFGFVEFEAREDAEDAIDNMHNAGGRRGRLATHRPARTILGGSSREGAFLLALNDCSHLLSYLP